MSVLSRAIAPKGITFDLLIGIAMSVLGRAIAPIVSKSITFDLLIAQCVLMVCLHAQWTKPP